MSIAMPPDTSAIDVRVVRALAHPTRVRILAVLQDRELVSPVELSTELALPLGTVGYHVRRLEALGFIELAKRTQRRGAVEHHYRARAALDLPRRPPMTRHGGGAHAASIMDEAHGALGHGGFDHLAARADQRVVTLDARGRARLSTAIDGWRTTMERVERASARRVAAGRGVAASHACTAVMMLFDVPADVAGSSAE